MDLKEIKVLTKQARAALREKEYKTALKHCKEILKLDKLNYNAWVFIGVSAQEIEQPVQAEAAFRKAIEISPDQLLAWQGLCQFYEKNDGKEYKEKLIGTYIETLKLMKDDKNKQLEVIKKLWEIYIQLDKAKQCLDIVQARIEAANGNALEKNNCWFDTLKILENQKELSQEEKILLRRCYNELIQSESVERKELNLDVFKNYLQLLRKENEYDKIVSVLKTYMKNYSESDQVLEHYCVTAVEMFIEREIIMEETFEIANSLRLKTASPIAFLALGIVADLKREYSDAIDLYKSCLSANEKCISGYFLLTRTFLKIYKYSEAKSAALTGLKLELSSKSSVTVNIRNMLHLYLAEALAGQHIWKQALQFLDKAMAKLGRTQKCLESLCKIYLKMNEIDKAKELCAELRTNGECLQTLQLDAAIHIFENDYKEAEHKLQKAIGLKYEGSTLYLLGLLYWNTSRTKESFDYFMKAAKEDPYYSKNFLYLGHYYLKNNHDFIKALKCYKKAFELDIYEEEAGIALTDILKEMKEDETNLQVLQKVVKQSPIGSAKWARFRLGLYYLHHENISLAIDTLQGALHCDPTDSQCWETIGEAYLLRGSYNSALKSFEKAVELNPSNLHSRYCVAQILLITGIYTDAIKEFQNILKIEPFYIAAFKGLAESFLYQAKYYLNECFFGRFKDCCRDAICILSRAVNLQPRFSCLWKLLGDSLTLPAALDSEYFPFSLSGELLNKNLEMIELGKAEMLVLGGKFYGQALALHPEISSIWHDLGINYYHQSKVLNEKKKLAEKSLLCLEKAISMSPNKSMYWNTLGIIAACNELMDYSLSQHSFIKAIEYENDNAAAWTNLGVLYLLHNEVQLAHKAFSIAQKSDPSYSVCWIGQALIAEAVKHNQTTDLFRHTTTIGNHPEGLLGYGHWVCEALKEKINRNSQWYKENIIDMNAISVALDCMIKYTENNKNCPIAFNILGLLFERQGLFRESLNAFERSIQLQKQMKPDLQDILVNCARLCIVNKKPEEAIKHFLKIVKHNEFSLCSLGLAYYHTGNYDKCDKAYLEAEKFASSEEIKSSILVARSIIIKQVQGLKKMKLFLENSEVNYFEGLRMLCALSILENDTKLARTTLAELEQYKDDPKYLFSITFLNSCFYIIQEKKEDAKRQLCKAVFKFPNNGFTWIHLAFILLHQYNNSSVSLKIMKAASLLHKTVLNSPLTPLCHLAAGNVKSGLKESEKLLHLRPDSPSNWVLLLTCSRAARIPNINHLFRFVENLVETNKHCTKLLTYLCLEKVIYHLDTNNLSDAKLTLDKLMQVEAKDNYTLRVIEFMNILCNSIDGPTSLDGECLKRLEVQCRKIPTFTWAILETVKLYLKVKKEEEAIEFLQQLLLYEKTSPSSRWMLHIQLSLIAYRILKEDPGRHRYESVCRRNAEEAARLRPRSPISHFLTAAAAEVAGDSRWRERSLRRVWENTGGEEELRIRELSRRILDQIRRPEDHSAPF